jgi:hypothetical protein
MNSTLLDTRSPFRTRRGPVHLQVNTRPMETRGDSVDLVLFRRLVHQLIRAPRRDRAGALAKVVSHIQASRYPLECVNHLLFECAANGGSDGLDIAIDVLSQVGSVALAAADRFHIRDAARLNNTVEPLHSVNDDAWYALLRGLCRSKVQPMQKLVAVVRIVYAAAPGAKEAAAHALGDLAYHHPAYKRAARMMLEHLAKNASSSVRETAAEVLNDMEG